MKFRSIHKYIWVFLIFIAILTACNQYENNNSPKDILSNIKEDEKDTDNIEAIKIEEKEIENSSEENAKEEANVLSDITENNNITLLMVGDVLLHTKINESGKMEDGTYNYDHLFANVKEDILAADLAIVNQEVILGGTELGLSGYPTFNGAYEVGDSLAKAGFDVILHATNHTLDKGKKGVQNCLNFWKNTYPELAVLGINESQKAHDSYIYVYEKDGIKVAILNYTYGTNGIKLPSDMPYIVNLLDKKLIEAHVKRAKELADFIIVAPHWGTEYQLTPSKNQINLATYMAELGVDLVIGTHPHVIQPVEWIESTNGNRMLVYYSIGNFINSTAGTGAGVANRMVGAMAKVTLARNEKGKVYIEEYGAEPLVTHMKTGPGLITTYKFSDYTEELASENEIIKQDSNFTFKYCIDLWNKVYANNFALEY